MDIQSFLIGLQAGKNAGGGSSADVRYVTFMSYDGLTEVGKLPVATGYDCPNPKFTATRESDAQYTYTQDGWSTTANGDLDSNALKEVNEDRTVYAHFKATLRTYTITYLDDDGSVLKTETLAYGTMPSYTPMKDGVTFDTWEPALTTVIGDASYTAKWTEQVKFASSAWIDIVAVINAGNAANVFSVGDKRTETLNYADGTTEEIDLIVANLGGSKLADGSTSSLDIVLGHALKTKQKMGGSQSQYRDSTLLAWLDDTFYNALPEELRSAIKARNVNSYGTTLNYCWIPSAKELGYTGSDFIDLDGSIAFPLFSSNANRIRTLGKSGSATGYWSRTCTYASSFIRYCCVNENGSFTVNANNGTVGTNEVGVVVGMSL